VRSIAKVAPVNSRHRHPGVAHAILSSTGKRLNDLRSPP